MVTEISIWNALADPKRRQIISLLEEKPRTTSELCGFFDVSRFAVMKHLKVLQQANLITSERQGRSRWNALNSDLVQFLRTKLDDDVGEGQSIVEILDLLPGHGSVTPPPTPSIRAELFLEAAPAAVFDHLIRDINSWWQPRAVEGSTIHLEPFAGGRCYEAFDESGQGILYAHVTTIRYGQELRLRGTRELGERIADIPCSDASIRIMLDEEEGGTLLSLTQESMGGIDDLTQQAIEQHWRLVLEDGFAAQLRGNAALQPEP
jgi:DNA-binding transcriptional ArsR family regulator